jgi:hypothetical protein
MIVIYDLSVIRLLRLFLLSFSTIHVNWIVDSTKIGFFDRLKICILKNLKIAFIDKRDLKIKDCLDSNNVALQLGVEDIARDYSLDFVSGMLIKYNFTSFLPAYFINNLKLFLGQHYYDYFFKALIRIALFNYHYHNTKTVLNLTVNPIIIDYLKNKYPRISMTSTRDSFSEGLITFIGFAVNVTYLGLGMYPVHSTKNSSDLKTVLCTHNDHIHFDSTLRNKLVWALHDKLAHLKIYCIVPDSNLSYKIKRDSEIRKNLTLFKLYFLGFSRFFFVKNYNQLIKESLYLLILNPHTRLAVKLSLCLKIIQFILNLENSYNIAKRLNTKVYIYEDSYHLSSHVFNVLAGAGHLKTIQLQYSYLFKNNILMASNASYLFTFSSYFDNYFKIVKHSIKPNNCSEVGYSLIKVSTEMKGESWNLRNSLVNNKVNFVIGIFDESLQDNSTWAWKTKQDLLIEMENTYRFLLANPTIAIIYKTQFVNNNPLKLFRDNIIIKNLVATNRFITPETGFHRNLILPSQVALAADFCISDVVGATAGLESALLGTPSVFIDPVRIGPVNRKEFYELKLVYRDMADVLDRFDLDSWQDFKVKNYYSWNKILRSLKFTPFNSDEIQDHILKIIDVK